MELVDGGEDNTVVLLQELLQMLSTPGMCLLPFDHISIFECLIDLFIQVFTICYEQKSPVALQLIVDLLDKEDHRVALPAPLSMPEDAQLIIIGTTLFQNLDSI